MEAVRGWVWIFSGIAQCFLHSNSLRKKHKQKTMTTYPYLASSLILRRPRSFTVPFTSLPLPSDMFSAKSCSWRHSPFCIQKANHNARALTVGFARDSLQDFRQWITVFERGLAICLQKKMLPKVEKDRKGDVESQVSKTCWGQKCLKIPWFA